MPSLRPVVLVFTLLFTALHCTESFSQSQKRGASGNSDIRANSINSRWHYRWHYLRPEGIYNDSDWTPMLFGAGNDTTLNNRIDYLLAQDGIEQVLGFNEPERANQGNTTVERAVEAWTTITNRFAGTGIELVSPAVSDNAEGREWLADFMQGVDDHSLQIDAVAFHWYGNVNPNNPQASANAFLSRVDDYYNTYQKPIWITEFAGHDWQDQYTDEVMLQANAEFLKHVVPGLESRSYVHRYAWFQFTPEHNLAREEGFLNEVDEHGLLRPTIVGMAYMPDQALVSGESLDLQGQSQGLDYFYMQGGSITNSGAELSNQSVGGIYTLQGDDGTLVASTLTGTSDWGLPTAAFVRVEENSTLRKEGSNTISFHDSKLYIDGQVRLMGGAGNEGTLWIANPEIVAGNGKFRLDQGSHLRLGRTTDLSAVDFSYQVDFRGGLISIDGLGVNLSGPMTLYDTTQINVSQDVFFSGDISQNPNDLQTGIVKTGDGALRLAGTNTFTGLIDVQQGSLFVDGTSNGNQIDVASGALLGGVGIMSSHVEVQGALAPGNSIGTLTSDSVAFLDGSRFIVELESLSSFDQLVVNGNLSIDPNTTLEIALLNDFIPSVGDQFQFLNFGSVSGAFLVFDAPALQDGKWDFSQFASNGLVVVSVPEPGSLLIPSILSLALVYRRRKS